MHDIAFDGIHDEIVVTSPLAQAILTFRGAANGEEAPIRYIQGDKTQIKGVGAAGKVSIDPVHDEIFLATPDQTILVFDRHATKETSPPKRVLGGPDTQLQLGKQNTDKTGAHGAMEEATLRPCASIRSTTSCVVPTEGRRRQAERFWFSTARPAETLRRRRSFRDRWAWANQFEIYAPKLRLVTQEQGNYIEIWKIPESGVSTDQPMRIRSSFGQGRRGHWNRSRSPAQRGDHRHVSRQQRGDLLGSGGL